MSQGRFRTDFAESQVYDRLRQGNPLPPRATQTVRNRSQGDAMSFALYTIGFVIMIVGLIYAGHLLHVPTHWIVVGAVVLTGIGILTGAKATRQKDPPQ